MKNFLEKAIHIACDVHEGQVDKAGNIYILHPLRLMFKFQDFEEKITAVLHDVVEDGDVTLKDLEDMGFNHTILDAIDCLSRRENETYEGFINRIRSNSLATKIKIEDIKDNLDLTRFDAIEQKDLLRAAKYHEALMSLLGKANETC